MTTVIRSWQCATTVTTLHQMRAKHHPEHPTNRQHLELRTQICIFVVFKRLRMRTPTGGALHIGLHSPGTLFLYPHPFFFLQRALYGLFCFPSGSFHDWRCRRPGGHVSKRTPNRLQMGVLLNFPTLTCAGRNRPRAFSVSRFANRWSCLQYFRILCNKLKYHGWITISTRAYYGSREGKKGAVSTVLSTKALMVAHSPADRTIQE